MERQISIIILSLCEHVKKTYPSAWYINKTAVKTFYEYFVNRNRSLRKPKATRLAPATVFNTTNVESSFSKYKQLQEKYNKRRDL